MRSLLPGSAGGDREDLGARRHLSPGPQGSGELAAAYWRYTQAVQIRQCGSRGSRSGGLGRVLTQDVLPCQFCRVQWGTSDAHSIFACLAQPPTSQLALPPCLLLKFVWPAGGSPGCRRGSGPEGACGCGGTPPGGGEATALLCMICMLRLLRLLCCAVLSLQRCTTLKFHCQLPVNCPQPASISNSAAVLSPPPPHKHHQIGCGVVACLPPTNTPPSSHTHPTRLTPLSSRPP